MRIAEKCKLELEKFRKITEKKEGRKITENREGRTHEIIKIKDHFRNED